MTSLKDAARYRWLKEKSLGNVIHDVDDFNVKFTIIDIGMYIEVDNVHIGLDEYIDSQIKLGENKNETKGNGVHS